ncbi:uncharacterized protein COLE_04127 [Cutaneotrichosporon oleaginosum]|uniref:uncharacterized protein n=1 Tax=Cutaneotrichosporon oleaginosum TaxID=879819 RepID=UPI00132C588D|nr:hypothetical protein COLE_04127 [Cutaneotrichosporon oleaginosum]
MKPRTSTSAKPPAPHPSAAQQAAYAHSIADLELPKTTLTKLAKGSIPDNVKMQQDVVQALLRGSTLFINYLCEAAHDQAIARSGKQITAGDVLKAVADMDFGPSDALLPLLEQELASYRALQAAAKSRKPPAKKRKAADASETGDAGDAGEAAADEEEEEDEDEGDEGEEGGEEGEGEEDEAEENGA